MTKRFIQFAVISIIMVVSNFSYACEQHTAALKSNLERNIAEYKKTHTLNAIYAIEKDDKLLVNGASGYFDIENKKPLKVNNRMAIASGTKQMTAAAILKLQERGKLNVNDVVAKYLTKDSYYFAGELPEWANKVTLHQLLTHTSGLPEYIFGIKLDMTKPHKEINKSIVDFAKTQPLNFNPGKQFQYSNTGYVILGLIIEELSGKTLRDFFNDELFKPLGMKNTELATLKKALDFQFGKLKEFPKRYNAIPTNDKPKFIPIDNSIILAPFADGGVISNLDDLNTWNHALHNGKVLSSESYKLMTTPYAKTPSLQGFDSHIGYGIFVVKPHNGDIFYLHGGNAIGIRGEYVYIPAHKIALSIVSNIYVYEPKELKGKIDYKLPVNQIDIRYFMEMLLKTIHS
jgi:CubicO group peptidase (beta-lactamase class C family)